MHRGRRGDLRRDGGDVTRVDMADATVARGRAEAAGCSDRTSHHQEVLHVRVVLEERVAKARRDQALLDFELAAPTRDR
jgi:hypothetical protein